MWSPAVKDSSGRVSEPRPGGGRCPVPQPRQAGALTALPVPHGLSAVSET